MDLTTAKTVAVFVIVIGCFAVLYPKIFHPMFFGSGKSRKDSSDDLMNRMPPHMRGKQPDGAADAARRQEAMNMARQMHRHGPHPGMRAAAEMKKAQAGGGGRGMMGIILPVYAVGIVLYLVYTLAKVFTKKNDEKEYQNNLREHYKELRYDPQRKKFTFGNMDPEESHTHYEDRSGIDFFADRQNQHNLEDLLLKADERNIGEYEMQQLRSKLEETEAQMARILEAMQVVQNQTDTLNKSTSGPVDSSPDLNTYEVVQGRTKGSLEDTEDYAEFYNNEDYVDDDYEDSDRSEAHIEDIGPIDDDYEVGVRYNTNEVSVSSDVNQEINIPDSEACHLHGNDDNDDENIGDQNLCNHGDDIDDNNDGEFDSVVAAAADAQEDIDTVISSPVQDDVQENYNLRHRHVAQQQDGDGDHDNQE